MSGTVVPGPEIWRQHAQKSLVVLDEARATDSVHVEVGGGGPYDPGMEARMATVEADLKEIKGVLGRLEPLLGRMDDRMRKMEAETLPKLGTELAELKRTRLAASQHHSANRVRARRARDRRVPRFFVH